MSTGRNKAQVVPTPEVMAFVEEMTPALTDFQKVTHACPHCNQPVLYPLLVRQEHAETFQMLIDAANKYLHKTGVTAAMLADIRAQCIIAIASRKP